MKRVCVVCEGQTEEEFILQVLAPAFYDLGLNLVPEMIETSPGHKGGALRYARVKRHLRNTLRQNSAPVVTTLFDLYHLDVDFPGMSAAQETPELSQRLRILTEALHADVVDEAGCAPDRFIPHIQPHEFEALLFSDVATLVTVEPAWQQAEAVLTAARAAVASPEHINDHPDTKPAARLERALKSPSYRKSLHGPTAARKIGLTKMEEECASFAGWLARIRALAQP
ncbi:DUF4276 family protein [Rhizobacter sp. OV335]|jgi:hypothetical protein|uniref:DUF4276 family protein n=1 Tax=Rhizobacter sp. OV335 TaxID=1500264 RepID=UPI00091397E5|nr:DUF4276 family protein [Rhizobacter sp. OV335]SHL97512.1 protein of unknown function [Rhizobacter sp. OV335]